MDSSNAGLQLGKIRNNGNDDIKFDAFGNNSDSADTAVTVRMSVSMHLALAMPTRRLQTRKCRLRLLAPPLMVGWRR